MAAHWAQYNFRRTKVQGTLSDEVLQQAFAEIDSDASGYIEGAELTAAVARWSQSTGQMAPSPKAMLAFADLDGDGRISMSEFIKVMRYEPPKGLDAAKVRAHPCTSPHDLGAAAGCRSRVPPRRTHARSLHVPLASLFPGSGATSPLPIATRPTRPSWTSVSRPAPQPPSTCRHGPELEEAFQAFCSFGNAKNPLTELDNAKFAKLCKDARGRSVEPAGSRARPDPLRFCALPRGIWSGAFGRRSCWTSDSRRWTPT